MSEPEERLRAAAQRARALEAEHRELASQLADVAAFSAQVHEQAAAVHEDLDQALLSPAELRAHAQRDRELEASERRAAQDRSAD